MKRRTLLGTLARTSLGVLFEESFTQLARSHRNTQGDANFAGQLPYESSEVKVAGNTLFVRRYGNVSSNSFFLPKRAIADFLVQHISKGTSPDA